MKTKTVIPLAILVSAAASAAIAPGLHTNKIAERHIGLPGDDELTIDETSTRGQWVTSYSNKPGTGDNPTVDETSTRGQWVTSYSNNKEVFRNTPTVDKTSTRGQWVSSYSNDYEPSVDETSTRGKWVSSYQNKGKFDDEPTVDETSTRGRWVSSYPNNKWSTVEHVDHWLPTGPAYLDINTLEEGYKVHMMVMHDSSTWLHSGISMVKRFLGGEDE